MSKELIQLLMTKLLPKKIPLREDMQASFSLQPQRKKLFTPFMRMFLTSKVFSKIQNNSNFSLKMLV
jgi:hypothetical protein